MLYKSIAVGLLSVFLSAFTPSPKPTRILVDSLVPLVNLTCPPPPLIPSCPACPPSTSLFDLVLGAALATLFQLSVNIGLRRLGGRAEAVSVPRTRLPSESDTASDDGRVEGPTSRSKVVATSSSTCLSLEERAALQVRQVKTRQGIA